MTASMELLESSDESEDEDDFHTRRRAFKAGVRGERGGSRVGAMVGATPGGRAGVAARLLSQIADGPGSCHVWEKRKQAKLPVKRPKPALPRVRSPSKLPGTEATETPGSSGRAPRVDLAQMRQDARETTNKEAVPSSTRSSIDADRRQQPRPPAQKRAADGRRPMVSPRMSASSSKNFDVGATPRRAAKLGAAAAGGSDARRSAVAGESGKKLTGLQRLREAANKVIVVNRLGNYIKTDTRRKPEEARKKAEMKQLKVVWKSVDVDGGGTLDREELRQVLTKMGKNLTDEQLDSTMKQVDEDGSGEVEFEEFSRWWDTYMSSEAAVPPTPFNFGGQCVRALKINGSEFWWVASDVANVLFPPEPVAVQMSDAQKMHLKKAEQKKLRIIWKKVRALALPLSCSLTL